MMARRKPPRFFLSRLFVVLAAIGISATTLVFFLMLSAETQALRKARSVDLGALRSLQVLMNGRDPEGVPHQFNLLSEMSGGRVVLLDPDGKPAFRNSTTLRKIQSFTRVPDTWFHSPHGPFVFAWPPSGVPRGLAEEVSRLAARKGDHHLLTNRQGIPTPLQPNGGMAVWSLPVPNAPSCAQCHGFDREILGSAVSFVPVPSLFPDSRRVSLWGFWPLPELNQKIIFSTVSVFAGVLFLSLIAFDEWQIRRRWSKVETETSSRKTKRSSPGEGTKIIRPEGISAETLSLDPSDVPDLFHRISSLDKELEKEIGLLPHAGIQPQVPQKNNEDRLRDALDRLSSWTDAAELLAMDLGALAATRPDPLLSKAVEALSRLKNQALELQRELEVEGEEDARRMPSYNELKEEDKRWVEELRSGLQKIHAEMRAIGGLAKRSPVLSPESPSRKS